MSAQRQSFGYLILAGAAAFVVATALVRKQDSYRQTVAAAAAAAPEETADAASALNTAMPMRDAVSASKFLVPAYPGAKLPTLSAANTDLLAEPSRPKRQ